MKKLKAFGHPWHIAHQYELFKMPEIEWSWLVQHRRQTGNVPRGDLVEQFNIEWVDSYEAGKYDFALLHFDQQCIAPKLWEKGKGSLFRELSSIITDIPIIVICHGTPYYPEMFPAKNEFGEDCDGLSQELIDSAKKMTKGMYVIMNSKTASKQWGFGTPIWHGIDPDEWYDLPKEPRVVTMISPGGLDKYYDREFLQAIRESLWDEGIQHCHITVDWASKNWEEYKQFLGRSLVYINPTKESPMPRSRTEAMISGCCVLTTPFQDADEFIVNGKNGYLIGVPEDYKNEYATLRNPYNVAELVKELILDYDKAIEIGQAGKKTALETFNWDRYHEDWMKFLDESITDFNSKK
jgi:hypothetical protein